MTITLSCQLVNFLTSIILFPIGIIVGIFPAGLLLSIGDENE